MNRVRAALDKGYGAYRAWRRANQEDSSDEDLSWQDDEAKAAGTSYQPTPGLLARLKKAQITKASWSTYYPGRKDYGECPRRNHEVHTRHWELIRLKRARAKDPQTWSDTSEADWD